MTALSRLPNVLVVSGHDPSGGAGFQADIETVAAMGAHAAGMLTALTRQDTRNAYSVTPVSLPGFTAAVETLLADMSFAAIKVGLLGDARQAAAIAGWAAARTDTPLVLDPVLRAGGGASLASDPVTRALQTQLFGRATIITPNAAEARALCPDAIDIDHCGRLLSRQTHWALITGGDEPGDDVVNSLFAHGEPVVRYRWPRLEGTFHGSGCTLAAAIAARLAHGDTVADAVGVAQRYTWRCLAGAFTPGRGQRIPDRLARTHR